MFLEEKDECSWLSIIHSTLDPLFSTVLCLEDVYRAGPSHDVTHVSKVEVEVKAAQLLGRGGTTSLLLLRW